MQRADPRDRRRERLRNLRVADVGDVHFAVRQHDIVNFRVEGLTTSPAVPE